MTSTSRILRISANRQIYRLVVMEEPEDTAINKFQLELFNLNSAHNVPPQIVAILKHVKSSVSSAFEGDKKIENDACLLSYIRESKNVANETKFGAKEECMAHSWKSTSRTS
eukprot:TRINITY_DN517_c1_g1_i5.p1 TRINITY_DN517_c1_g1~~TRINITY_DN517_c1_g1_i5.p1  ORF type:complete len:112 (-),score=26.58 TRINITY_DN517_c1_g1_i5:175-510(-)